MAKPGSLRIGPRRAAGFRPGEDIAIALDPAASGFYAGGAYNLERSGQGPKTSAQMTDLYESWLAKLPIVSLEDGLAETDWDGFASTPPGSANKYKLSVTIIT